MRNLCRTAKSVGFTLVELLVVVGIISLLISILLPALNKARESANRIQCSSNLRTYGQAAFNFAAQRKGIFPKAYVTGYAGSIGFPIPYPNAIEAYAGTKARVGENLYPGSDAYFRNLGVDAETLIRCGMARGSEPIPLGSPFTVTVWGDNVGKVFRCPSGTAFQPYTFDWDTTTSKEWGTGYGVNYMYVSGYQKDPSKFSTLWDECPPAIKMSQRGAATAVLASDNTRANDGYSAGGLKYSNHGVVIYPGSKWAPKYTNILYGDGHVSGESAGYFRQRADRVNGLDMFNYSLKVPGEGYWYW